MSSYKAADLQAAQKTIYYKYDKQGNLLSDGSNTYSYDGFSRLSRAEMSNGKVQVNRYDAEGLRHEMEENGELVKFLFSGDKVVAEKEGNGNVIRYIRGLGIISSDSESARTYYHYVSDEQGSITHILRGEEKEEAEEIGRVAFAGVEEAGSKVLNYYEYDAFGNATVVRETVGNRFRYDGEQYDAVMEQYYLRARYYNPVIGRFTQEDTYYGDGLNLYAYCGNNPVGYEDPSGHEVCPTQKNVYSKDKNAEGQSGDKGDNNPIETPINSGKSQPRKTATPNSIYEQLNTDGTVKSRAFYDQNGNQFCRQDFDHPHFDKKTQQYYQPHEHNYTYNENGQRNGKSVRPLPPGYNNRPTR